MKQISSKTILFITGAFVSHHCWDEWISYFESKGYSATAPAWPGKETDADILRSQHPFSTIAMITLSHLVAYYTYVIQQLPEKPILIGHSLGGLIVQILLNKGLGAAGIALHSVPPQGVIPFEFSFYKSNLAALGFFTSLDKTYLISFKKWQYVFTNEMSFEEQKTGYERYAIPESKRAIRGGLTNAAKVNFRKEHNPLLIMAGSLDHCMPATLNRRNFKRYKSKTSVTDFALRDGRNHFVLGQPTWREDASFILEWINRH